RNKRMNEEHSLRCKPVKVRRRDYRIAINRRVRIAPVICDGNEYIGASLLPEGELTDELTANDNDDCGKLNPPGPETTALLHKTCNVALPILTLNPVSSRLQLPGFSTGSAASSGGSSSSR